MTEHTEAEKLLQKHFDIALETPDGIKKLRELILTLAMQGKLVKQDPKDQPASELLKEIEAEKKRLVKEGKIRKQEPLPPIKPDEIPYKLPNGWEWARLNDVSTKIHYGYTASANHDLKDIRLLRITDIQDNKVEWESVPGCEIKERDVEQYLLNNKDILIARTGGTVGKSYLVEDVSVKAVFASYLIRIVPSGNIDVKYLKYFIEGPIYWKQLYAKCSGTGQPNVNGTSLGTLLLTLPPLAEQKRIVARIDQLMALCDKLEDERNARDQKRLDVHAAAINLLLAASGPADFDKSWQFMVKHFSELYAVPANVAELKKVILQLAVMGKLVKQDPNDQPASELLKEIEAEKQRLVKAGKIRKQELLPPIKPAEIPYKVPNGWRWVNLQDLFALVTDGDHQAPPKSDSGIPFLVIGNLNTGKIVLENCRYVPINYYESLDWCKKPAENDILYTVTGSYGIPILVENDDKFCVQRHVAIFKAVKSSPNEYLYYLLKSVSAFNYATSIATGIAQKTVPLTGLRKMPIPIPPLAEQKRIVARIDQLMALCDTLGQQLAAATGKQTAILDAVLSKI